MPKQTLRNVGSLRRAGAALSLLAVFGAAGGADDVVSTTDPDTGLKNWRFEGDGLAIELVQVPPDFIRASYARRGLPVSIIEAVATRCVFGTIVRNVALAPLSYRVADWRYTAADGREHAIKTKSEWLREWRDMGVRFSWSILADDSTFAVGDWIQGFTTMPEPHGSRLALKVVWSVEGKHHEKILQDLECAPAPD
ncbi:MAG: hypothetical protein KDJ39_07710 [Gammaproteobacteria bacterium]|nr:hypothetical protein [Gammaproteobacteria bacterium]MCP5298731.1 hypothetical protein [Chromatiaceae bacterium]